MRVETRGIIYIMSRRVFRWNNNRATRIKVGLFLYREVTEIEKEH